MGNKTQEDIRMIRSTLRLILITMFLGFAFLWIMMPTNTYKLKWQPLIKAKVSNSTYFGSQGYTILLYTFPVLLFACIGCVYIHLGKKVDSYDTKSGKKDRLVIWKQPMLVKGPLGIVSSIEIAFFMMFIALLVWSFSTYLHNSFAKITPASAAKSGEKLWESKLESSGLRLGLVGNIVLAVLFYPVTRGSSVLSLVGLTSEASVKYHIWLGHVIMTLFTAHGLCYLILWIATNEISRMIEWNKTDISNLAGEIALLAGLLMWITTIPRIRRKMFELFFYTHYLYIVFVVFFFFHVGISYSCMMLPGFYLFVVDRYLRFLQSRRNVRLIAARVLRCEALELNFSKNPGLKYHPTSTLFINVPSISKLQWHPFTITSSSNLEADRLSIMIKCEGSWTKKLYQTLSSTGLDRLQVSVEGPYGPVSTNFLRHDMLVMISGGSGITPFISIIRDLIHAQTARKSKTPRVLLVSAFKTSEDLSILELIMPLTGTPSESDLASLDLKIEAYVTREKQAREETPEKTSVLTKWLKPQPSDSVISAVLGPNSWLWLGAVIASSFVIFLVLIAIITRYYIYPIDHNTNDVFSYTWRVALNMLAFFFALGLTTGFAVFVNKNRNAMEAKQILGLDGSPTATPESTFENTDRELESLPLQSLAQSTNLHYGQRPDLKSILFECKGSSIGVLVSGPKTLRHDVAKICSSGLVENLHFESISFSW